MTAKFAVITTRQFDRESGKLLRSHVDFDGHLAYAIETLSGDPYNISRAHPIKKLTTVPAGEGQYRLRSGRFRFRYDVDAKQQTVYLKACSLRREDTY
jgi:mRNA-degrading endonuclease RelE of RelBE toxin-antitoxin system